MLVNYDSSSEEEQAQKVKLLNLPQNTSEKNNCKDTNLTENNQVNKKRPISQAYDPESEEEYQEECPVVDKYIKTEESSSNFTEKNKKNQVFMPPQLKNKEGNIPTI